MKAKITNYKKAIQIIGLLLLFTLPNVSFALERLLVKDVTYGPEIMKQYSITRTNDNDGFIIAGNTISLSGNQVVHIFRIDDNGVLTWNFYFQHNASAFHQCTHVDTNVGGTGYIVSGYIDLNNNGEPRPFLLEVNEMGFEQNLIFMEKLGVFLKVKATPKGNYVAVGYKSPKTQINTYSREGWLVQFDNNLVEQWNWQFKSHFVYDSEIAATTLPLYMNRFDILETVDAFLYGDDEFYLIGGTFTDTANNGLDTIACVYAGLLDETGIRFWENQFLSTTAPPFKIERLNGVVSDIKYDPYSETVWLSGNYGGMQSQPVVGFLMELLLWHPGDIIQATFFEGSASTQYPSFHLLYTNNIQITEDKVWIFGTIPDDLQGNTICPYDEEELPVIVIFDKSDINDLNNVESRFFYNSSANYCGYPDFFPKDLLGVRYCFSNSTNQVCPEHPYFTTDIGRLFVKDQTMYFAILGIEGVNPSSGPWSLELISDLDNDFCDEYENEILLYSFYYATNDPTFYWQGQVLDTHYMTFYDLQSGFSSAEDCFGDDPNNLLLIHDVNQTSIYTPENLDNDVLLFPNPSSGEFNIYLIAESSFFNQIQVKDVSGKIIQSFYPVKALKRYSGNLQLPAGVYIFEISLSDGSFKRFKWVVN